MAVYSSLLWLVRKEALLSCLAQDLVDCDKESVVVINNFKLSLVDNWFKIVVVEERLYTWIMFILVWSALKQLIVNGLVFAYGGSR